MTRKEIVNRNNAKPETKARKLQWYHDNKEKVKQQIAVRRAKNPDVFKLNALNYHYRKNFGLPGIPNKQPCELCGSAYRPHLHHRDGKNGKNGNSLNNDLNNLVWLCNPCHTSVHNHGKIRVLV